MSTNTDRPIEFAEERRAHIVDMVNLRGRVKVIDLAEELNVTAPTIRKDIAALDQQRKLRRTHGGALATTPSIEVTIDDRRSSHAAEKQRIAAACLALISPGDSVFLDAGTTTLAIAEHLLAAASGSADQRERVRGLNILTNSIPVAQALAEVGSIHHTLLGGQYRPIADSLAGPVALQTIEQFTVNAAFIGVTGVADGRFSVADLAEADLKRKIIKQARRIIVPMDASKIGLTDFVTVCELKDVDVLVTDAKEDALAAQCASAGVALVHAD